MQKIRVASVKTPWISTWLTLDRGLRYEVARHRSLVASLSGLPATAFRNMHIGGGKRVVSAHQDETREIARNKSVVAPLSAASSTATLRNMHFTRVTSTVTTKERGFFLRMLYKFIPDPERYKRQLNGFLLYEDIAHNVKYSNFFKDFKMPDTFYSWFVIMELHVWMLMTRYMAEGKEGREIRNSIVEAMWSDVNRRKSKLKNANISALKTQVNDLSQQFNAAIIGYDEGIMSDDKVLAGALWRRFFQCECNNPEYLEKLLVYVRKQVNELDKISSEECMKRKRTQWIKYDRP